MCLYYIMVMELEESIMIHESKQDQADGLLPNLQWRQIPMKLCH